MSQASTDARRLDQAGRGDEAVARLDSAIAAGDADAAITLGLWRIAGRNGASDPAAARALFGLAADAGLRGGLQLLAALLAQGVGGSRDWPGAVALVEREAALDRFAARQAALIAAMAIDADGAPIALPPAEPIRTAPDIRLQRGLLAPDECTWLIDAGHGRLKPAVVVDPVSGRQVAHPIRTARSVAFPLLLESPAVHAINRRIAAATDTDVAQGEPLQLLAYASGEEYRAHVDTVPGTDNQRIWTALTYLNAAYRGGATRFVEARFEVQGRTGDALLFRNVTPDGAPDPATRHAGMPVTAGTKYLASRWIRARRYAEPT